MSTDHAVLGKEQTLLTHPETVWSQRNWAERMDWQRALPPHYATLRRMLDIAQTRCPLPPICV